MAILRFTTTRLSGLQAAGRIQDLQHAVVAPFLERELGASYGRLFADFEMESADVRAWYVEAEAAPIRIGDLPRERQAALRETLAAMLVRIASLAKTMEHESLQRAHVARVLETALVFPEEDVWALGDEPLLVNWGFRRSETAAPASAAILERIRPSSSSEPAKAEAISPPLKTAPDTDGPDTDAPVSRDGSARRVSLGRNPFWKNLSWPDLQRLRAPLWVLFAGLVLAWVWELMPACTSWPVLSSLKACRSIDWQRGQRQRLVAELDGETRRLADCNAARAAAPPQAVLDALARVPRLGSSHQRDIVVAWNSRAQLKMMFACPEGSTTFVGELGADACGVHIVAEANMPGAEMSEIPVDRAVVAETAPRNVKISVSLVGYNGLPDGTSVPFLVLERIGSTTAWRQGQVDHLGHVQYFDIH